MNRKEIPDGKPNRLDGSWPFPFSFSGSLPIAARSAGLAATRCQVLLVPGGPDLQPPRRPEYVLQHPWATCFKVELPKDPLVAASQNRGPLRIGCVASWNSSCCLPCLTCVEAERPCNKRVGQSPTEQQMLPHPKAGKDEG